MFEQNPRSSTFMTVVSCYIQSWINKAAGNNATKEISLKMRAFLEMLLNLKEFKNAISFATRSQLISI